ncbi:hypothetical protein BK126_05300 [Paenibacillus sp. FSL H7-0326]|uniref:hypothetical protein n=1 Tax=Paenibacillus sp. FSL H7-0326 TaxID=1921144 RepID=UPI00096C9DB7|nr:hypothetical protein [Paenibacillus sp. FSL H7-0326]OMC71496.1 hypothetical protein BK126_05300 [Paenibacillus sp. FSL H7-0326]
MAFTRPNAKNEIFFKQRVSIYLACEEMDFTWSREEVKEVDQMWNEGIDVRSIANKVQRDPDELLILIIDRAKKGFIKQRTRGLFGTEVINLELC